MVDWETTRSSSRDDDCGRWAEAIFVGVLVVFGIGMTVWSGIDLIRAFLR